MIALWKQLFGQLSQPMDQPDNPTEPPYFRLIVGLGNPGDEYAGTRHNVGFDLLDQIASSNSTKWQREKKFKSKACEIDGVIYAKPLTFMNLSGIAVARICRARNINRDQVLIVYDDVDTQLGQIKFKAKGSAGGHNGIKSIIEHLGSNEFARLKIGIGAGSGEMVEHVLGRFEDHEKELLEKSLAQSADGVLYALARGLNPAMNEFNRREKK
ncbi:MAG: aminoacyl-tRNA hydrolase, partial [Verrucomicrobiota bacterium]